jgi:hypothetical protein
VRTEGCSLRKRVAILASLACWAGVLSAKADFHPGCLDEPRQILPDRSGVSVPFSESLLDVTFQDKWITGCEVDPAPSFRSAPILPSTTEESVVAGLLNPLNQEVVLPAEADTASHDDLAGGLSTNAEIRELPPLPGSAALFLSALASVGAWHLARSVRHLQFHAIPAWYHDGGPEQIGHAVPFDLDFNAPALCALVSLRNVTDQGSLSCRISPDRRSHCAAQSHLTARDTRGPPLLSF